MQTATYLGIDYLRNKLKKKRTRVRTRYRYYEGKQTVRDFGISTPPSLLGYQNVLQWCSKEVDSLSDRLQLIEFKNDDIGVNDIFKENGGNELCSAAILEALIGSCSFIYIRQDEAGNPAMQLISAYNATGIMDLSNRFLTEGYAVLEEDRYHRPTVEAYFTIETTTVIYADGKTISADNPTPYPLLVPVVYRPDATRPFGHSRISRASMDICNSAVRTAKRSEITAEFYAFPQKWATGLETTLDEQKRWQATMSSMLSFGTDEDGNKPTIGQFEAASMEPHLMQLKMFAALFAGEADLTLDDLGFATENPSSAEAIKAAHENLRCTARKAQECFGAALARAGYLAACLQAGDHIDKSKLYQLKATWEPVFEPDAAMLAGIGDGANKINQAIPDYFGPDNLRTIIGIPASGGDA